MPKAKECVVRLHGRSREIIVGPFESLVKAREWLRCWDLPYTIVKEDHKGYHLYKKLAYGKNV